MLYPVIMRSRFALIVLVLVSIALPDAPGADPARAKRKRKGAKRASMVTIPAGSYRVTKPGGDTPSQIERVNIAAFKIDRQEVSVAQYRRCVRSAKCSEPQTGTYFSLAQRRQDFKQFCNWEHQGREDHPINCIDREQAREYCAFVGKKLPTSAQWEAANYGGDSPQQRRSFAFGDKLDDGTRLCRDRKTQRLGTCPTRRSDDDRTTHGVRDLASNVSEWTATDACPGAVSKCRNPMAVIRGGNWYNSYAVAVGVKRARLVLPKTYDHILGFRCVSK